MVQRSAARVYYNNYLIEPGVVTGMLSGLEWPSLEGRRTLSRVSIFHRVVYGAVDIEREPYLILMAQASRNGNSKRFLRPHSNCNQHANSFFPWGINYWNKLPGALIDIHASRAWHYRSVRSACWEGEPRKGSTNSSSPYWIYFNVETA